MKKLAILGSTGSIGQSALKIVQHLPHLFCVEALAAHSNVDILRAQIRLFSPKVVAVYCPEKAQLVQAEFPHIRVVAGEAGLEEVAALPEVAVVLMAIVGLAALAPTMAALRVGKTVALASKEVLVSAGELVQGLVQTHGGRLLPVDSEHSALFQCLEGRLLAHVQRLVLTASGGPFRQSSVEELQHVSVAQALRHPTWAMGPKVTIDSSNLMNKGLEMVEARWLFAIPPENIEVVIHPQSIIHSFVEFIDGIVLAQIHEPNMIYPIQYALTYPDRAPSMFPPFDFMKHGKLEFFPPDVARFPALTLAQAALTLPSSFSCFLNAANEVLVHRFLQGDISWRGIVECLDKLLNRHNPSSLDSLEAVLSLDQHARHEAIKVSP